LENISSDEPKSSGIQVILKECVGPPAQTVTVGESRVGNVKEQRKEGGRLLTDAESLSSTF